MPIHNADQFGVNIFGNSLIRFFLNWYEIHFS